MFISIYYCYYSSLILYRECPNWLLFYDISEIDLKSVELLPFFSDITSFADGVYVNKHQIFIEPHDIEFADRLINAIQSFALYYGCGDFVSNVKCVSLCINILIIYIYIYFIYLFE